MKKFLKEFKEFAMKGNVLDMAIGVIIATAFGKIVSSLINDVLMPIISLVTGGVNVSSWLIPLKSVPEGTAKTVEALTEAGISFISIGTFLQAIIDFVCVALCIFVFLKAINKMKKKPAPAPAAAPTTKKCPFCCTDIAIEATRCPHCTSELKK